METDVNKGFPSENEANYTDNTAESTEKQKKEEIPRRHHQASHYNVYVPKHSSHGRSNDRTFGANHEPGTIL